jgi:hypothetical protein
VGLILLGFLSERSDLRPAFTIPVTSAIPCVRESAPVEGCSGAGRYRGDSPREGVLGLDSVRGMLWLIVLGSLFPLGSAVPESELPPNDGGLWEEMGRGHDLDAQVPIPESRRKERRAIVDKVLAGQMTLEQATQRFLELNQMQPECMTALRLANSGVSDEECVRRQVLRYVQRARDESSAEAEAAPTQAGAIPGTP